MHVANGSTVMTTMTLNKPGACPFCRAEDGIAAVARVLGGAVICVWRCGVCSRDWPITPTEHERRSGPVDRRRHTRAERRSSRSGSDSS